MNLSKETKRKLRVVLKYTNHTLYATAAILAGYCFYKCGDNYLSRVPIIAILITATSLYFTVMNSALTKINEYKKVWNDIKNTATELPQDVDRDKRQVLIDSANMSLDACKDFVKVLKENLNIQIILIGVVVLMALFDEIAKTCWDVDTWQRLLAGTLNNTAILYSIGYTLYIVKDTTKIIFFVHEEI